jgi:glycosyltransferase involved in cell wall biosynthesis
MRVAILRRAQAIVAPTENERRLVETLAGPLRRVEVIGNGIDPQDGPTPELPELPDDYVALLGTVSRRKGQYAAIETLGRAGITAVVVGGFDGSAEERAQFEQAVARAGTRWMGEIQDPSIVREVLRRARALLHPSTAEAQSIAVVEALGVGTPVLLRPIPANRELASSYPDHVRVIDSLDEVPSVLERLARPAGPAPVPTWGDVARRLEELYRTLLARV